MKLKLFLILALVAIGAAQIVHAEGERREEGRRQAFAPRPAPPKFAAHPQGPHPHGPIVRPHPIRILQPRVIPYNTHTWSHWEHPEFARPAYYWDWTLVHNVTCVAEDSYGDQYPVTEATVSGFGLINMTTIEDDAMDRCYSESGSDPSCFLLTCSHF
jgi:hypothetical protein